MRKLPRSWSKWALRTSRGVTKMSNKFPSSLLSCVAVSLCRCVLCVCGGVAVTRESQSHFSRSSPTRRPSTLSTHTRTKTKTHHTHRGKTPQSKLNSESPSRGLARRKRREMDRFSARGSALKAKEQRRASVLAKWRTPSKPNERVAKKTEGKYIGSLNGSRGHGSSSSAGRSGHSDSSRASGSGAGTRSGGVSESEGVTKKDLAVIGAGLIAFEEALSPKAPSRKETSPTLSMLSSRAEEATRKAMLAGLSRLKKMG